MNLFGFRMNQSYLKVALPDSLRIDQLNTSSNVSWHYLFDKTTVSQTITLSASTNACSNLNKEYVYSFESNNMAYNGSFSTQFKKTKFLIAETMALYTGGSNSSKTQSYTGGVNMSKQMYKEKLAVQLSTSYTSSYINGSTLGSTVAFQGGVVFRPNQMNTLSVNGGLQENFHSPQPSVYLTSINVRYSMNFSQIKFSNKSSTK